MWKLSACLILSNPKAVLISGPGASGDGTITVSLSGGNSEKQGSPENFLVTIVDARLAITRRLWAQLG